MAKQKQAEKPTVASIDIITRECGEKGCSVTYEARKITYSDGKVTVTPPRCPTCQTAHLTNLRVNKAIKDLSLLANLKARLSNVQRDAVINALTGEFQSLMDSYAGSKTEHRAFDLKTVKA